MMHDLRMVIGKALIAWTWLPKSDRLLDIAWAWSRGEPFVIPNIGLGSAMDAIAWMVEEVCPGRVDIGPGEEREFLKSWHQGDLDEWPEYRTWLEARYRRA